MAKVNAKGRTKKLTFVMLTHQLMDSPAYRSLSPSSRAVYLQIIRLYNGYNNGDINLGCRDAGELCNISKNTAAICFQELTEKGFIKIGRDSSFNVKTRKSRSWILTNQPLKNTPPTNEWIKWRPALKKK